MHLFLVLFSDYKSALSNMMKTDLHFLRMHNITDPNKQIYMFMLITQTANFKMLYHFI